MRMMYVLLLLPGLSWAGPLYRWVDSSGGEHFTDDASTVPASCRHRVLSVEQPETKAPPRMPVPHQKDNKVMTPKEVAPRRDNPASDDDEYYYGFVDEDEGRLV